MAVFSKILQKNQFLAFKKTLFTKNENLGLDLKLKICKG